jgi:ABC-type anion transport system duplicated permease subunit
MPAESPTETAGLTTEDRGLARPAGAVPAGNDIAARATAKVEQVVSLVRDKTVNPVSRGVQYLILGLLSLAVLALVAVLFAIFALRVLDNEIPPFTHRIWASYLVLAGIFWLAGAFLSRRRRPHKK